MEESKKEDVKPVDTTHRPARTCFSLMSFSVVVVDSVKIVCVLAFVCVWQQSCMIPLLLEPALLYCDLARRRTLGDLVEPKLRRPTRRTLVLAVIQSGPGFGTFWKYVSAIFAHVVSRASVILWCTEKEKLGCCCWYRRSRRWCALSEWTPTTNWGEGRSYLQPHKWTNASRKEKE